MFLGNCPPTRPLANILLKVRSTSVSVNVDLGEGNVGSFPETCNDPIFFLPWAKDPKAKVFVQSRNTCKI